MSAFAFDKTGLTSIKTCLDALIAKCGELASHYKSAGDNGADCAAVLEQESSALTEWRDSCARAINGTARHEVTKESLHDWLSNLQEMLDSTTGLVIMFGMDPDLPETVQTQWEGLAGEFEKLDALVRSERELYR